MRPSLTAKNVFHFFGGGFLALGKQAKILSDKQVGAVLRELGNQRYPARDRTMFLLRLPALTKLKCRISGLLLGAKAIRGQKRR